MDKPPKYNTNIALYVILTTMEKNASITVNLGMIVMVITIVTVLVHVSACQAGQEINAMTVSCGLVVEVR